MRLWQAVTVLTLLGVKFVQSKSLVESVPNCSLDCVAETLSDYECSPSQSPCICSNLWLINDMTDCTVGPNCSSADPQALRNVVTAFCSVDHRDRGPQILIVCGIFGGLSLLVTLLRLYDRPPFTIAFGLDDVLLVLSELALAPMAILLCVSTGFGNGNDIGTATRSDIILAGKYLYACELLYVWTITTTKLSILLSYLRIFQSYEFKRLVYIIAAVNIAYGIAAIVTYIFQCHPISRAWTQQLSSSDYGCINVQDFIYIISALNILLDIVVIAIPVPQVLRLQLTPVKKMQVLMMFCVGIFVTAISIVRIQSNINILNTPNFTYDLIPLAVWSVVECSCSVICCCLPTLARLYRGLLGKTGIYRPSENVETSRATVTSPRAADKNSISAHI